jgi:sugar phosphate isomerase/epimerase/L-amino acid N-acyltransferase YncA
MINIGLKLWSTNKNYIGQAIRLHKNSSYQYIELFCVPESFQTHADLWIELKESFGINFIIHAPHFAQGMNLAKAECFNNNMKLANEALHFADMLDAQHVIFHPGFGGDDHEAARQLRAINDKRIVVENKPYRASMYAPVKISREQVCNGNSPEAIAQIMSDAGVGFCFDFGHAICSANDQGIDPMVYIKKFLALTPSMFHLTDGDWAGVDDQHPHLGTGNFRLKEIISLLPQDCMLTLETVHDFQDSLADFEADVVYLRALEKQRDETVYFVPARHTDMRHVFELSNDPIVRQSSINSEPIIWDNHVLWFQNKLNDEQSHFYVIKNKEHDFVGYVRFDKEQDTPAYVITIHLASEYRGKGLGSSLISQASRLVCQTTGIKNIYAYIKETNTPSIKSFTKAQYSFTQKKIIKNDAYHVGTFDYENTVDHD